MEQPNLKCCLCGEAFDSEQERREHERVKHSAEVREKEPRVPGRDEDETAA